MFLKSDIQADNELSLPEIIEWVEGNMKAMEVFARFGINIIIFHNNYWFCFLKQISTNLIIKKLNIKYFRT